MHKIELEIKEFIENCQEQPSFVQFMEHFKNRSKIVEYMVIASLYLDYDAEGLINENFKNNKDSEKIESLIEEYGEFPELAEMFIPVNLISASIYKDFNEREKAQDIILKLLNNYSEYYSEIYSIKDLLFEGKINLEIPQCPMESNSIVLFLKEKMKLGEITSFGDDISRLNFDHFIFYHLNLFAVFNDIESLQKMIEDYHIKRDATLNPVSLFSCFIFGELNETNVGFEFNLNQFKNLINGSDFLKIQIKTDLMGFLKTLGSTLVKDKINEEITDYLISKIPMGQELKLGKSIIQAMLSSMTEMGNVSFLSQELELHKNEILTSNVSIREYYINSFLPNEFRKFFQENQLEYVEGELNGLYNRLYSNFMVSVSSLISPDIEAIMMKERPSYKKHDSDTKRFLLVCDYMRDDRYKTKIAISRYS